MSRFIKLTSAGGHPTYCQPDDIKALKRSHAGMTLVLLYGAEQVWLEVSESAAEVIALVEPPAAKAAVSSAFYGRN